MDFLLSIYYNTKERYLSVNKKESVFNVVTWYKMEKNTLMKLKLQKKEETIWNQKRPSNTMGKHD